MNWPNLHKQKCPGSRFRISFTWVKITKDLILKLPRCNVFGVSLVKKKWKFERIKVIAAHYRSSNCSSCVIYFEQQIEEIRRDNHFRLRLRIKVSLLYSPRGFATPLPLMISRAARLHSLFGGSPHSKGEKLIEDFLKRKRIYENLLENLRRLCYWYWNLMFHLVKQIYRPLLQLIIQQV